ncbi:MAG: flagellar assembly protein FliW [Planctomycetota bacterium]|jgi:flagellar assembly factor FliW
MQISTTRFGEIEIEQESVLRFPEGLIGFSEVDEYIIVPNPSGGPFQWLQAVKIPGLAFCVCDPVVFKPDYCVEVHHAELETINVKSVDEAAIVVILVIPQGNALEMTANLRGPIVINTREMLAKQLVLVGDEYPVKYRLFQEEDHAGAQQSAQGRGPC